MVGAMAFSPSRTRLNMDTGRSGAGSDFSLRVAARSSLSCAVSSSVLASA
jgi:hypothetical protein